MYYFLYTINALLMLLPAPLAAERLSRARRIGWSLFFIGAGTFFLSQLLHIPFNMLVQNVWQLVPARPETETELVTLALFAGLSAGVFEEVARYLMYRLWARQARSWGQGVMLGLGHGGLEALIVGVIFAINFVLLSLMRAGWLGGGFAGEDQELVQAAITTLFSQPLSITFLGGIERVLALTLHVGLSLLVLRTVTANRPVWLALAILYHALVDAAAVYANYTWGPLPTEAIVAILVLPAALFIWRSRAPEPLPMPADPLPPPPPLLPATRSVAAEKLDDSRFV